MSAPSHHHGHDVGEKLYVHQHSFVHFMPAHLKILSFLAFVLVVVATPIQFWPAFVGYLGLVLATARLSKLPLGLLARRAVIEVPFVLFAVLMPLAGSGASLQVGPLRLYESGLVAGASILAKGTLGVLMSVILSTSTTARDLLRGLERLRLPAVMVQIAAFMLRYLNVVTDEMTRMKVAREARGFTAKTIRDWRVIATAAGALFIRSYERGERVHLAMLSRGFTGTLPRLEEHASTSTQRLMAAALPSAAALCSMTAILIWK